MRTLTLMTALAAVMVSATLTATRPVSSAGAAPLSGVVQTGGTGIPQPLANVKVTLFEATTGRPAVLGQATTDAVGAFSIPSPKSSSSSIFFVRADLGRGVDFLAILGPDLPPSVTVNELTTVAAAYSTAQFARTGVIAGPAFPLQLAAGMNDNVVDTATGESSPVLLSSPNADESHSLRMTRSLANLLVACVDHRRIAAAFLKLTRPPRGPAPRTTAEALANLARDPGQNVKSIFHLSKLRRAYAPSLARIPDAWTVTVKVNDSGSDDRLIAGPGNLAFDARGIAWVTNNVTQSSTKSGDFIVALQPNGRPADGTNGTPLSPITGGGILGPGFGVGVDPRGSVWVGNFGWGGDNPTAMGNGSVSQFTPSGDPISGALGYQGGPVRAQATVSDTLGNIWIASYHTGSLFVFPGGDPDRPVEFLQYENSQPFDIAIAADGTAWVTNGLVGDHPSSVARYAFVNGALQQLFLRFVGRALKAVALDSRGNAWVASHGNHRVYAFLPNGREIGHYNGGGINGPWGVAVDGEDNVWVTNFGPIRPGSNFTTGGLTKLAGINPATRPPGKKVGDPLSPATGYTVHTAGSQVLLHNGEPLYGSGGPPSFAPMMRQTSAVIDQAGNIWTVNNWKPDFDIDIASNPGGDGIIIFVGLAPPPPPAS